MRRTTVYIDGFNLYHRLLKGSPYKWLDLRAMCSHLLPDPHVITRIKYFTALVSGRNDVDTPIRQKTYLRAIQSHIPILEIYYGKFMTHEVMAKLVTSINGQPYARIYKTEEKGSDVNMAVHILNDAWLNEYDSAVIISNDSDIAESLRLVRAQHPKKILGLLSPVNAPSKELQKNVNFTKIIRKGVLASSQLPSPIPGTSIHKPPTW